MTRIVLRGPAAELRWGYYVAATLGAWTVTVKDGIGELTASVVSADTFRTSQPSLTFYVSRQNSRPWVWPVDTLQIAGGTLTARLGSQQE